ncbi:cation/H(+) antiporter 15-like [Gossypium australe]|uniref:Cation/H(+) antiporter 15-like n=1 Tax=Gossypium australe TaxID=47621 RepID=A0A5B6WKU0_9ROSI|nr:cation/H(+) antiporter 15-like [Gossypium australe]
MLQVILSVLISRILHAFLKPLRQSKLVSNILLIHGEGNGLPETERAVREVVEEICSKETESIGCSIRAGVILGPSILGGNKTYMEKMFAPKEMVVLATMSNMAVYLYMFVVCIKMDAIMLTKAAKHTWKLGFCCFVFPIIFTIAVAIWQNYFLPGASDSAFPLQFTIMSSISYFIVITRALDELNLLSSKVGQISLSVAMHNEETSYEFKYVVARCHISQLSMVFLIEIPYLHFTTWYGKCHTYVS